ncbi:MAG: hypothetical protein IKS19_01780 [Clostridia bacterium]|nr:hypothetical protein [Clostridia bacterium]
MHEDDRDMKIVGSEGSASPDTIAQEHKIQKDNGNLEKAKKLGNTMAKEVMAWADVSECEPQQLLNEQILYIFACTVAFDNFTPSRMTAVTALSAFYDRLKEYSADFYNTISCSPAFSFYYLCLRNRNDLGRCVGETFAMLCDNSEDERLAKKGRELYAQFLSSAQGISRRLEFN